MENKELTLAQQKKKELFAQKKNGYDKLAEGELALITEYCQGYKTFLDEGKTERECVDYAIALAEAAGFKPLVRGMELKPGDKVYANNRGRALNLAVIGKKSLAEGAVIGAAHIDAPRLDLKQNPLYEDKEMAYLKTHYYGGIKKYQWTTIPLSLHGVIVKGDGTTVTVNIGEDEGDPQFVITDLLPHLAKEQEKRTLADAIKGEDLNVLVGSLPFKGEEESELVKLNILKILNEKYGIVEKDFLTAELELVPAFKARDIGFDRSLIAAYGHDDKVCSYPAAIANFEVEDPEYTVVTILTDKEEIGSDGNTGLNSSYFKYFVEDLGENAGIPGHDILSASECLSADVTAGMDPTYPEPMEANNASYISKGVCICKYTGSRGKYSTSDATAEFFGKVRGLLDDQGIVWQTGELGKVDAGGGGTVAMYLAALDIDVIDIGTPVLSMHAPYEVISKLDLYSTYQAMYAFFDQK